MSEKNLKDDDKGPGKNPKKRLVDELSTEEKLLQPEEPKKKATTEKHGKSLEMETRVALGKLINTEKKEADKSVEPEDAKEKALMEKIFPSEKPKEGTSVEDLDPLDPSIPVELRMRTILQNFVKSMVPKKEITEEELDQPVEQPDLETDDTGNKVTVIGVGQVGKDAVLTMLTLRRTVEDYIYDEMYLADIINVEDHSDLPKKTKIEARLGPQVCVVTAEVEELPGESEIALAHKYLKVFKVIIPQLLKLHPDTIFIISSDPVDVMTYFAWKISGLPTHRVFGYGTNLDTVRFRFLLAENLNISPAICAGYVYGRYGDSFPVWAGVKIAGIRMYPDTHTCDGGSWSQAHQNAVEDPYRVIKSMSHTPKAMGISMAQLTRCVFANIKAVHTVSTYVKGEYGISQEAFLSLPCRLGSGGVLEIIREPLDEFMQDRLRHSARQMIMEQQLVEDL